jgi:hypothetical protein
MRRGAALWAAAFLFFLLYSSPHRVHHFFEQVQPQSHEHSHDHRDASSNDSDCVFQSAASRCSVGLTAQIEPLTLTLIVHSPVFFHESSSQDQFLTGSFQIRAPPQA